STKGYLETNDSKLESSTFTGESGESVIDDLEGIGLPAPIYAGHQLDQLSNGLCLSRKMLLVSLNPPLPLFQRRGSASNGLSRVCLGIFPWSSGLSQHSMHISDPRTRL